MTAAPVFAPIRRATCALTAGPARAAAWLVSPRGIFVTSHSAVGYHLDVELETDAGDARPGRVVWVDVGRDLAFVLLEGPLPRATEPMAPLALREVPSVKSGDRVFLVSALRGRGLRIVPSQVCAAPKGAPRELIDVDAPLVGPAGGPVVDVDSRAVGVLVRGGDAVAPSSMDRRARVLPSAEIRGALRVLEPAVDLARRAPVYRCPACVSPFVPEHDACLVCGVPLPHPFPPDPARVAAERTVREALASIGVVANRARTGPRSWHLVSRPPAGDPVPVTLALDEAGATAALRAPVVVAGRAAREPFYRLLLTLNDHTTGPFRLALDGDRVVLLFAVPVEMLEHDLAQTLTSIGEVAEHYRKILHEGFAAAPLASLAAAPEW